jgi:exopolysaccharide biosynthesis WecB/TagA/CpsF family protein
VDVAKSRHSAHIDRAHVDKLWPSRDLPKTLTLNVRFFEEMANVLNIDDYDLEQTLKAVAEFGNDSYGYVVTPNVDHVIRHYQDQQFRALYAHATYVLLDSRFLAHTVGLFKRQVLRVCLGSDLTSAVLSSIIKPLDVAVLVGGTPAQAQILRERFGLKAFHHIDPPMNFIRDPSAVETCLRQIEAVGPFRFCFLAIGSPQQEVIALKLKERGVARGLALCIGAAINFMTGVERRAPLWMQHLGFEWLFRLLLNPRRMAKRYLVRGPRIFLLLPRIELRVRRPAVRPGEIRDITVPITTAALPTPAAPMPVPTTQIIRNPVRAA